MSWNFLKRKCEICNHPLKGSKNIIKYRYKDGKIAKLKICTDCANVIDNDVAVIDDE